MTSSPATRYFEGWAHRYDADMARFAYKEPDILFRAVRPHIQIDAKPLEILDIGIGTGLSSLPFRSAFPDAHITGIDASDAMLAQCRVSKIADRLIKTNIEHGPLPFDNACFDVVLSAGVLEYLDAPDMFVAEVARVLKPSGIAALCIEPQSMRHHYKSGVLRGVIRDTGHQTTIRSFVKRGLWPLTYLRYLYAPEAIQNLLSANNLSVLDSASYDAYQWPNHPAPIRHHCFIAKTLS